MIKRRIITLCFAMIMCFSTSVALAAPNEVTDNTGVSTTMPINPLINDGGISTNSTSMPDKSDVYTNGIENSIKGSATGSSLYTNYCFKGVTSISYKIINENSTTLTIKLRKYYGIGQLRVETKTIPANSTQWATFSGLSSSTYYFIEFCAPSECSGYVKGNE